ncbi:streptococcal hemagglutinin-like [Procambarus clarkii]|uniref:streptococcal hemagglutinin-like n=1 Tax=Procambarus clarkii TaxID=6728 RepID=UPI003743539A
MSRSCPLLIVSALVLLPLTTSLAAIQSRDQQAQLVGFNDDGGARDDAKAEFNASGAADGGGETDGVLRRVLGALWRKVHPYVTREDASSLPQRLDAFKRRLLTKADALIDAYTRAAHRRGEWERLIRREAGAGLVRYRRQGGRIQQPLYQDTDGVPVLAAVEGAVRLGAPGAGAVHMTVWRGKLIVAIIDNAMNVSLYTVDQRTWQVKHTSGPPGKHACDFGHLPGDGLLLVCISTGQSVQFQGFFGSEHVTGTDVVVYQVTEEASGRGTLRLQFMHTIPTESPRYVHVWTQEKRNIFLIVANSKYVARTKSSEAVTYHTTSRIYRWTGLYFDVVQELPTTDPRAAHHFTIHKHHFLAIANFKNNKGEHNCQSIIYSYSVHKGRYVPFQELSTRGATHFQSFTLGTGLISDTFLAVANFCENDELGMVNHHTASSIYRFQMGKFVLFQEIPTTRAVQWLAIQVEDTALLALASSATGVTFYQYNGWRFEPTAVQHTDGPFGAGVTSMASVTWQGTVFIGVSNTGEVSGDPTLYTVSFTTDKSLQDFHEATQARCQRIKSQLESRDVGTLRQQVSEAPKVTQPYSFTQPVVHQGNLAVLATGLAAQVYIGAREEWLPSSWSRLKVKREAVEQQLSRARTKTLDTLSLAGPASWPANLHIAHLIFPGMVTGSSVDDLRPIRVNREGVPSGGDLVRVADPRALHMTRLHLGHVDLQSAAKVERLQGQLVSVFVTLSGRHFISGRTTFPGAVRAASVENPSAVVDGVVVNKLTLLLSTASQTHTGKVSCENLEVGALDVNTINNVNINQLFQSLVTRDAPAAAVTGELRVVSDLVAPGNLEAKVIANMDLTSPLKTDDLQLQVVSGDHRVGGMRCLSARVTGRVNGVRVPGEVFQRHSHLSYSVSSAAFTHLLAASLTINTALHTITVSDMMLDVLRLMGTQVVTARKTFSSMHLLQEDPSAGPTTTSGRRRRRETHSGELACSLLDGHSLEENEARREVLLAALGHLTAAQDLLTTLADVHPGRLTLPRQSVSFYAALAQDASCAFSQADDDNGILFFDANRGDGTNEVKDFDTESIALVVENVERFITNLTGQLHNLQLGWHDVFMIFSDAKRNTIATDETLHILELLRLAFEKSDAQPDDIKDCEVPCLGIKYPETSDFGERGKTCKRVESINSALRRVHRYPSIIETMRQLSASQTQVLQTAVVEHALGRIVDVIRRDGKLREALDVAASCGVPLERRGDMQGVLRMLKDYGEMLKKAAAIYFTVGNDTAPSVSDFSNVLGDVSTTTLVLPAGHLSRQTTYDVVNRTGELAESFTLESPFTLSGLPSINSEEYLNSTNVYDDLKHETIASENSTVGKIEITDVRKKHLLENLLNLLEILQKYKTKNIPSPQRSARQTSDSLKQVESFERILKDYIRDISSGSDLRVIVSKWNLSSLVLEFIKMENMFYDSPELITSDVDNKIIHVNRLIDEISEIIIAYEGSRQEMKSNLTSKVSTENTSVLSTNETINQALSTKGLSSRSSTEVPLLSPKQSTEVPPLPAEFSDLKDTGLKNLITKIIGIYKSPISTTSVSLVSHLKTEESLMPESSTTEPTRLQSSVTAKTSTQTPSTSRASLNDSFTFLGHEDDRFGVHDTIIGDSLTSTFTNISVPAMAPTFVTRVSDPRIQRNMTLTTSPPDWRAKDPFRTITQEFHYSTATYFMHMTTYISCTDCTFLVPSYHSNGISKTVLMLATSATVPGEEEFNFRVSMASLTETSSISHIFSNLSHSSSLQINVTKIAHTSHPVNTLIQEAMTGEEFPLKTAVGETFGLSWSAQVTDVGNGTSKFHQKRSITDVPLNSRLVNEKDEYSGKSTRDKSTENGTPGVPVCHDVKGPSPQLPYLAVPYLGRNATHTISSATFFVIDAFQTGERSREFPYIIIPTSRPSVDKQMQYYSTGCYTSNFEFPGTNREISSNLSQTQESSQPSTSRYISSSPDGVAVINVVKEFHYTTATTHLKYLTTHIDCTGCIFMYPPSSVGTVFETSGSSTMHVTTRAQTRPNEVAEVVDATPPLANIHITIQTNIYQCTVTSTPGAILQLPSDRVCFYVASISSVESSCVETIAPSCATSTRGVDVESSENFIILDIEGTRSVTPTTTESITARAKPTAEPELAPPDTEFTQVKSLVPDIKAMEPSPSLPSPRTQASVSPPPTPSLSPRTEPSPSTTPSPSTEPSPRTTPSPSTEPSPRTSPSTEPSPRTSPSTEPSPRTSPSTEPSPRTTPSTEPSPRTSPSTEPSPRTTPSPSTEPSPRTTPSTEPSPRTTPSTEPPPRTTPSTEPSPRTTPSTDPLRGPLPRPTLSEDHSLDRALSEDHSLDRALSEDHSLDRALSEDHSLDRALSEDHSLDRALSEDHSLDRALSEDHSLDRALSEDHSLDRALSEDHSLDRALSEDHSLDRALSEDHSLDRALSEDHSLDRALSEDHSLDRALSEDHSLDRALSEDHSLDRALSEDHSLDRALSEDHSLDRALSEDHSLDRALSEDHSLDRALSEDHSLDRALSEDHSLDRALSEDHSLDRALSEDHSLDRALSEDHSLDRALSEDHSLDRALSEDHSLDRALSEDPSLDRALSEDPSLDRALSEDPSLDRALSEDPSLDRALSEDPSLDRALSEDPSLDRALSEDPSLDRALSEDPSLDRALSEDPSLDRALSEDPSLDRALSEDPSLDRALSEDPSLDRALSEDPSLDRALSEDPSLDRALSEDPSLDRALSEDPSLDRALSEDPSLDRALSEDPSLDRALSEDPSLDRALSEDPSLDRALSEDPSLDRALSEDPSLDRALSEDPSLDRALSEDPSLDRALSEDPSLDRALSEDPSLDRALSEDPSLDRALSEDPSLDRALSEDPSLDRALSEDPSLDRALSEDPSLDRALSEDPSLDRALSEDPSLDRALSEDPSLDRALSEDPSLDRALSEDPSLDRALSEDPSLDRALSEDPSLDRALSEDPSLDRALSEDPSLDRALSEDPSLDRALSEDPSLDRALSVDPSLDRALSVDPSLDRALSVDPSLDRALSVDPSLDRALSEDPSLDRALSVDPSLDRALSVDPSLDRALSVDPSLDRALSVDPSLDRALSVDPSLDRALSVDPSLDRALSVDPSLDRALSVDPSLDRALSVDPSLDRALSVDLSLSLDRALSVDLSLDRALSVDLSLDRALSQDLSLDRALSQDLSLSHDRALSQDLSLSHDRALSLDPSLSHDRALSLDPSHSHDRALSLDPSHDRALSLDPSHDRALSLDPSHDRALSLDPSHDRALS